MTKRIKILLASGGALLVVAAIVCVAAVKRARAEAPAQSVHSWIGYPKEKGPRVLLGYDGRYGRVQDALRIDVRRGVPHSRIDDSPISDLPGYITAQLDKRGYDWVIVTATHEERFGDIMRVIDECRTTRIDAILLNQFPETWRE